MKEKIFESMFSIPKKNIQLGLRINSIEWRKQSRDVVLGIIFFIINTFFLISLLDINIKSCSLLLTLSCLTIHFIILNISKSFKPINVTILVFMYLFMYLAPIAQLSASQLVNTYIPKSGEIELTNFYVFVFYIIFIMISNLKNTKESKSLSKLNNLEFSSFKLYGLIAILCLFIIVYKFGLNAILNIGLKDNNSGKAQMLIIQRIIFFTPVFIFSYIVCMKDKIQKNYRLLFFFSFILCIIMQNPLNEKRNTLGPIYLSILCISFLKSITKSNFRFFMFNFLLMGFAFPVSKILTHKNETFESAFKLVLLDNLRGLDYDAWSNFVASIGYTTKVGFTNGQQLLGTILFFIPRSIWENKPDTTGSLIGQWMIKNYNMWFDNLSFPYMAEGYIDFGIIGIIIFAIILGFAVRWLESSIKDYGYNRFVALYMAFVSYFVIRGALMTTFSYALGAAFVLIILPLIFQKIIMFINSKRIKI